jgi:hypothetical protein
LPYTCEIRVNGRVVCRNLGLAPTDVLSQHEGRKTGSHFPLFRAGSNSDGVWLTHAPGAVPGFLGQGYSIRRTGRAKARIAPHGSGNPRTDYEDVHAIRESSERLEKASRGLVWFTVGLIAETVALIALTIRRWWDGIHDRPILPDPEGRHAGDPDAIRLERIFGRSRARLHRRTRGLKLKVEVRRKPSDRTSIPPQRRPALSALNAAWRPRFLSLTFPRRDDDRQTDSRIGMRDNETIRVRLEQLRGQLSQWGTPDRTVFVTTPDECCGWIWALEWVLGKA